MRLDTAEKRAQYRQIMVPKGAMIDPRSDDKGAIYVYDMAGKFCAVAFWGGAGKPTWHYSYRKAEAREAKMAEFLASIATHQEYKAKRKAESSAAGHDVAVGDIFECSWGYDQTNIDYYQCVSLIGACMMEVRQICSQSEETGYLQGKCVPAPGVWATEADYSEAGKLYYAEHRHYPLIPKASRRVKIQKSGSSGPCFRVASYASAYRIEPVAVVAGAKIYRESHWTAYA